MAKRVIATILNFFFAGAGYVLVSPPPKKLLGVGWTLGAIGLTYVELSIQPLDAGLYWSMFGAVFLINTMFAIDVWRESAHLTN